MVKTLHALMSTKRGILHAKSHAEQQLQKYSLG